MSNHFLSLLDTFFSLMFIYSKKTEKCLFLNAHLIKWCLHLLLFSTFHHIKGYYIIEVFYDRKNNIFRTTGYIDFSDGRKAALENKHIIYISSTISNGLSFSYNLQPYAAEFLNKNLRENNIKIEGNNMRYNLQ